MFGEEVIECVEVTGLLVVHMFHQGPQVRVRFCKDWSLRGVDESRGEFSGLVDSKLRETSVRFD